MDVIFSWLILKHFCHNFYFLLDFNLNFSLTMSLIFFKPFLIEKFCKTSILRCSGYSAPCRQTDQKYLISFFLILELVTYICFKQNTDRPISAGTVEYTESNQNTDAFNFLRLRLKKVKFNNFLIFFFTF